MGLLLSAAQGRAVDRNIIEQLGLPGLVLMENAGRGVAEIIARDHPVLEGIEVRVVCGAGQNGGDGFVIARHLQRRGARVQVLLALPPDKINGDAAVFMRVFRALAPDRVHDLSSTADMSIWRRHLEGASIVVDALFGTGLRSDIKGVPAAAIAEMNAVNACRVAVDLPSGLDADTAEVHGCVVSADVTVTMGCRKLGLVLDADAPVGRVEVVDLGLAVENAVAAALQVGPICHWLETHEIAPLLPERGATGHKGTAGHLLAIAGSTGKTGAALLVARAALRSGAGLATIATTAAAQAALEAKVVAEMTASYQPEDPAGANAFELLAGLAARMKAAVIGPGMPLGSGMAALTQRLVAELPLPLVVDADALNLLGREGAAVVRKAKGARVLTPHPGEMARLQGCTTADIARDRLAHARQLAADSGAVVVLKGARTIVATPDGTAYVNPTATASLGTAGSGDVLTGTIGGLLAQGLAAKDAACVGVFVHGAAAEHAVRALGSQNLIASDLPDAIARACESLRSV